MLDFSAKNKERFWWSLDRIPAKLSKIMKTSTYALTGLIIMAAAFETLADGVVAPDAKLEKLAGEAARFKHVLLLGMGGSSLGPEVLAQTFGPQAG